MNILFRVDAGEKVGLGHFYRAVGLARFLSRSGHTVQFVHRSSSFWSALKEFEFDRYSFSEQYCDQEMIRLCNDLNCDVLFIDAIITFKPHIFDSLNKQIKTFFYQNISSSRHLCDVFILPSIHQDASFFLHFLTQPKFIKAWSMFYLTLRLRH
ncbi:hypothetical protein [Croceiramulus getboli]|nr:hypothetical protein P8624_13335 [Flavobacteriaceae bacterium YJPT1-3]